MARVCVEHPSQHSENLCGHCGLEFCPDCLVYPRGRRKLPLCVPCALTAGGVRSSARRRTGLSRRQIKRRVRERERELAQLAKFAAVAQEPPEVPVASPHEGDIARRIEAALAGTAPATDSGPPAAWSHAGHGADRETDLDPGYGTERDAARAPERDAAATTARSTSPSWLDDYFTTGDDGFR
jgi:hypothetical protein